MTPNKHRHFLRLACFTPMVMLATFLVESALAIYIAFRYSSNVFRTVVCVLILCLASFQLAEYQVCVGPTALALIWGKVGLTGITLLPALGMHLIGTVTRKSPMVRVGYAIAGLYIATFLFMPGATGAPECQGNYVIIKISGGLYGLMYEAYYFIFVSLAILELTLRLTATNPPPDYGFSRKLIAYTLAGYLSFTVPMAITGALSPELQKATPSIMCGFALMMAIILAARVAPLYVREAKALKIRG